MNCREKSALRTAHLDILQDLDVKDIAPVLYNTGAISFEQYEELVESKLTRRKLCQSFLITINKSTNKCTFSDLIHALRYENTYGFIANKLETILDVTENPDEVSTEETNNDIQNETETESQQELIYEPVRKIKVFTAQRNKMTKLAHELKRLTHDGQTERFGQITQLIHQKFEKNRLNLAQSINDKMELADMRFTALEAEVSAKRVKYDTSLCGSDVFKDMIEVIPYTSNPRVTSMTYLARHGSSIGMSDGVDSGLAYLQYAKQHAEYVTPCKDTGMVYYIEVNLLSQKYEATPNDDLKVKVLNTAQYAMSQFEGEDENMQNDFQRMLLLKMVFCYLGIGLFGNKIQNVETTERDIKAAKDCIDFIEKPKVWNGMEKRRKMLFLVAKTEYYRQTGSHDLAEMHAKQSRKLARQNGWKAELPNIEKLLRDIEEHRHEQSVQVVDDDFVQGLINDLTGERTPEAMTDAVTTDTTDFPVSENRHACNQKTEDFAEYRNCRFNDERLQYTPIADSSITENNSSSEFTFEALNERSGFQHDRETSDMEVQLSRPQPVFQGKKRMRFC